MTKLSRRQQLLAEHLTDHLQQEFRGCREGTQIPYRLSYGMRGDGDGPDAQKVIAAALDRVQAEFPNVRQVGAADVLYQDYDFINSPRPGRRPTAVPAPRPLPGVVVVACRLTVFVATGLALGACVARQAGLF